MIFLPDLIQFVKNLSILSIISHKIPTVLCRRKYRVRKSINAYKLQEERVPFFGEVVAKVEEVSNGSCYCLRKSSLRIENRKGTFRLGVNFPLLRSSLAVHPGALSGS